MVRDVPLYVNLDSHGCTPIERLVCFPVTTPLGLESCFLLLQPFDRGEFFFLVKIVFCGFWGVVFVLWFFFVLLWVFGFLRLGFPLS